MRLKTKNVIKKSIKMFFIGFGIFVIISPMYAQTYPYATASSWQHGGGSYYCPPSYAVDDSDTTRWASDFYEPDPQWIKIDYGWLRHFDRIRLYWETAYAKTYRVETSTYGVNWQTQYYTVNGSAGIRYINLPYKVTARYIKIQCIEKGTGWGYSLWDFSSNYVYTHSIIVFRNGVWFVDKNKDHMADLNFGFGTSGDRALAGDFDHDGNDDVAVFRSGTWYVDTNRDNMIDSSFGFGWSSDMPVVGDINQDGKDDIAIFRSGMWYVDTNKDHIADLSFGYGNPGDIPVVGDINQDGKDDIAIFRNGMWYVDTNKDHIADISFGFGWPSDVPVVGDVNQDGKHDVAVFRSGTWYVDTNRDHIADLSFGYGNPGDIPIVRDIR